jgi:hypothetical protein
VQGLCTPFRLKVPFFVEGCNFQTKIFPRKGTRSLHKPCFFATRKDVESYTQMPGKRILALEFSNRRSPCVPFFRGCTPRSRNLGSVPASRYEYPTEFAGGKGAVLKRHSPWMWNTLKLLRVLSSTAKDWVPSYQ